MYFGSDEIEALDGLSEVGMWDGDRLEVVSFGTVTDQVSKTMCILYGSGHLDGTCNIVVRIAELVGQLLDLVWVTSRVIIDDHVVSWAHDALPADLTDQKEIIRICSDYVRIDNGARHRIGQSVGVLAIEESLADALIHQAHE